MKKLVGSGSESELFNPDLDGSATLENKIGIFVTQSEQGTIKNKLPFAGCFSSVNDASNDVHLRTIFEDWQLLLFYYITMAESLLILEN